jgi:hypothetical protein
MGGEERKRVGVIMRIQVCASVYVHQHVWLFMRE